MPTSQGARTLAYSTIGCFALYLVVSAIQLAPNLSSFSGAEQFSIAKHLLTVAAIAAFVFFSPKIGGVVAVAWGIIVPLERYGAVWAELVAGTLDSSETFAVLDVARLILLLVATILSGILAYVAFRSGKSGRSSNEAERA